MTRMDLEYAPRQNPTRGIIGAVLGWLSVAFALLTCYQVVMLSFGSLWKITPGSSVYLMVPAAAITGTGIFTITVCGVLGVLCVTLQRGRVGAWVVAAIGFALALAVTPLGRWALGYVVAKHGLVDRG